MYLNAKSKKAKDYELIDLETNKVIERVIEADDIKGTYMIFLKDKEGGIVVDNEGYVIYRRMKGQIKLIKKANKEETNGK